MRVCRPLACLLDWALCQGLFSECGPVPLPDAPPQSRRYRVWQSKYEARKLSSHCSCAERAVHLHRALRRAIAFCSPPAFKTYKGSQTRGADE